MTKLDATGYAIRRRAYCTAHQWLTEAPCHDHGDARAVTRYAVVIPGTNGDGEPIDRPAYRANGDRVIFDHYSSAYSYVTR